MLGVERLGGVSGDAVVDGLVPPQVAPSVQVTSIPVRRTTRTCFTDGCPATASSTASLSDTALPRRYWPSVVITIFASASSMRARSADAENPANTTECMTPSRAQASIATIASGTIGM